MEPTSTYTVDDTVRDFEDWLHPWADATGRALADFSARIAPVVNVALDVALGLSLAMLATVLVFVGRDAWLAARDAFNRRLADQIRTAVEAAQAAQAEAPQAEAAQAQVPEADAPTGPIPVLALTGRHSLP